MAPARRYPPPIEQLVELLAAARARGLSFDEAWDEALRPGMSIVMSNTVNPPATALRWPTDKPEREAWRVALTGSRRYWQRAYERRPVTRPEQALVALADELGLTVPARGMGAQLAVA